MATKFPLQSAYEIPAREEKLTALAKALAYRWDVEGLFRNCVNCYHFNEATEICALANGQRPPARVIANGCPKHSDEIPF